MHEFMRLKYISITKILSNPVRLITGMDRNGPNYRNGQPEWTLTCAPKYFLCTLF